MSIGEAVTKEIEILAAPKKCFEMITDYESYPEWQPAIKAAMILESDSKGRGKVVEYKLSLLLKTVTYVLEYAYARGNEFSWKSIEGDIKHIEGAYKFTKKDSKTTLATYTQLVDPGFWVPAKAVDFLSGVAMWESIKVLKERCEA